MPRPGITVPSWALPDPEARRAEIVEDGFHSRALRRDQSFWCYLPARFSGSCAILLIVTTAVTTSSTPR